MRTVTVRSVLNGVAARMGMDITQPIPAHTRAAYLEYINERLREVWERAVWPEWTLVEERQFRADYNGSTTYAIGDEVLYTDDVYYRATAVTVGNAPTDTAYWEDASADLVRTVALAQAGESVIGEVLRVTRGDPRISRNPVPLEFSLIADGVLVPAGGARVWVEFTSPPPVFVEADLDASEFPYVLSNIVKLLAAADAQREDGQFDKAGVLESRGMDLLDQELDKIAMKQGQQGCFAA